MVRLLCAVALVSLVSVALADGDKPPKGAATIDKLVVVLEERVAQMAALQGECDKLAAVMTASLKSDNQVVADLIAATSGPDEQALYKYGQANYKDRLHEVIRKSQEGTLGCRDDKAVASAWEDNRLFSEIIGKLPAEPPPPPPPPPPGYGAKMKQYDAALAEYRAAADAIDAAKDCTAAAKLVAKFGRARDHLFAADDKLDKATREYLHHDKTRDEMPAIEKFMIASGRCQANKAYVKAKKAAKV
jgi:hypothetical protein